MKFRIRAGTTVISFLLAATAARPATEDPLERAETRSESWARARVEASRLEESWSLERSMRESALAGYKDRVTALREKHEIALAKTTQERAEIATLQEKAAESRADLERFEQRLKTLQASLVQLRPSLPPRLSSGLELAFRSLANPDLSPGERMQLTMTVLNRCAQFNRVITSGEEVATLDDKGPRAVQVIYWGLSHAYALDSATGEAWLGSPGKQGWHWEVTPAAAQAVQRLIAIYNDKADPEFVSIPATLKRERSDATK